MITIVHTTMMLGLIILPLLRLAKKTARQVVYKVDNDTTEARYAINSNGYLEKVSGNKVSSDQVID
jgi:hypothetical protein